MRNPLLLIAFLIAGLGQARGQTTFIVSLDTAQAGNAPTNHAQGLGTLALNGDGTLAYSIDYLGLTSDFVQAQLGGPAPVGSTGPSLLALTNRPTTARLGRLSGTTPVLTSAQKSDLNNGQLYVNVQTAAFSSGEIRGQITPAPLGPFSSGDWPVTKDASKRVHFRSIDGAFQPPSGSWIADELQVLSGGDQITQPISIGGQTGVKVTGRYFNIADQSYQEWADQDTIDILLQVYGDTSWLANGNPRLFSFLIGTLPATNQSFPVGGFLPVEINNKQWNWVLFRIANDFRPFDGQRFLGSVASNAQGGTQFGGVNGGTIRLEAVPGIIVRLVAFGQKGAFGEPAQVNLFPSGQTCAPEPPTNLVWNDINSNTKDHLEVLNNGDQTVTYQDNVGPGGDQRRAVQATGSYMNFGITDNYLGQPCNDPQAMKIGIEFYDDPALVDAVFGPEEYATDNLGGTTIFPADRRHRLEGSGKWIRRSFTVPAVNLQGVKTAPLTGGPRLIFEGGTPFISHVALGILRTGTNILAGEDPLPDWYEDPKICAGVYGNFVELDLGKGTINGLDVGTSGGDQIMVVEDAGPANDRRLAVRPDGIYLNFAILDSALGPSTQDNADLAICVTYYDDPTLTGATFRPEAYQTQRQGELTGVATSPDISVSLQGTDQWRDAYFEIPDMKFYGVNQQPQAAARFILTGPIHITRVRYAVIRPCGPQAGVNLLEAYKPVTAPVLSIAQDATNVRLFWPTNAVGFTLQAAPALASPQWTAVTNAPTVQGSQNVILQPILDTRFYRLAK